MKKISIVLSILVIILLTVSAYAWMQTEPSLGENVEYNRDFYVTDSDIQVKLYALIDNKYVLQGQYSDDELLNLELMYPGKTQRYRFELTNANPTPARVKIVFTEISGNVNLLKNYLKIGITNPIIDNFKLSDRLEYNTNDDRYFFDFADSVTIPEESTLNYYWNFEIDIDAPNTLQNTNLVINKIMFIKPS